MESRAVPGSSTVLVPDPSEDSVDIYEDLDVGADSGAKASSPVNARLKESMDLYEDLVAEEQQSRESSYTELKSRFQAAQHQIKELHRRLEQMEIQNSGLSSENQRLKKNISALLRTARQELTRKDAEIQRLNQRTEKGHHHHKFHFNNLQDPVSSSRTSTVGSISKVPVPPPPPSGLPPPRPASPSRDDHPPQHPPQPSRIESLTRSSNISLHNRSRRDAEVDGRRTESDKHKEERHKSRRLSESTEPRHRDGLDPNKDSRLPEKTRSHRADKDSGQRSCRPRPEGAKTSSPEASDNKKGGSRGRRQDKGKVTSSDYENARCQSLKEACSRGYGKPKNSHADDSCSRSRDRKKPSSQHAERCSEKERQKDNQRKGDKGPHGNSSSRHRRSPPEVERGERRTHKGKVEKSPKAARSLPEGANLDANSPNRKLCFMETLNLTVSPVKTPALPRENRPDEESSHPDFEDLCIIDEVDNSELDDPAERSPQNKASKEGSLVIADSQREVQEKEEHLSETADTSVQANSEGSQPLEADANITEPPGSHKDQPSWTVRDGLEPSELMRSELAPSAAATPAVPDSNQTALPQKTSPDSVRESLVSSNPKEAAAQDTNEDIRLESQEMPPAVPPPIHQQELSPPSSTTFPPDKVCCEAGGPEDLEAVTSTISLDSLPQEELSLTEAIHALTCSGSDASGTTAEPSSSTGCIGVSKVSSTTEEKKTVRTIIPKKSCSPGKSQASSAEPSSSLPLLHDEDSMMRTLSNLKRIPDAISPLRSPVRLTKRSLLHVNSKPGHVKSLQKEFTCSAVDASSKKLDVNKENKYPGRPANHDTQNLMEKGSDLPSNLSDTDLEEGEILSESDEAALTPPAPVPKRAKLAQPATNHPSPTFVLRRKPEERHTASKETAGVSTQSPRSRFKTVCPSASKVSFSTVEEIMEMFRLVRSEIRKKYMKLHKTFPKKSFYGVMDNFHKSFLEFVDGAHFDQICSKTDELKSKLKKLISSVFNKVLNNGIVKRIFEQQAVDLKQKLWDFVDIQVDYLFKDIHATLKSLCRPARDQAEDKTPPRNQKEPQQVPAKKPQRKQELNSSRNRPKSCAVVPYRTGLGSRGKDIRITLADSPPPSHQKPQTTEELLPQKTVPPTPEKNKISSLVVSQNGAVLDKTDFELLTEQQASSLTFNLVRDSQMGEIFKCLLQGSDLLESSGIAGDSTAWSLGTPRKDGERFISITTPSKFDTPSKLLSPTKFDTPSKLIATWSSISPRKMLSPRPRDQILLNPAFFDESCLLEVPSENRAQLQAGLTSQKSYSILAEDLAVSLTIPSPLKSDSHLSFLQPSNASMHIVSTPDSVISAHISEDALLDGEDATEQEFHLALDTDNSSCGSSSSVASGTPHASFLFKPDVPMQALVMEKSNDHFIVKIRQASTSLDITLTAEDSLNQTLTESEGVAAQDSRAGTQTDSREDDLSGLCQTRLQTLLTSHNNQDLSSHQDASADCFSQKDLHESAPSDDVSNGSPDSAYYKLTAGDTAGQTHEEDTSPSKTAVCLPERSTQQGRASQKPSSESERDEVGMSESERSLVIAEDTGSSPEKAQKDRDKGRKRKKCQEKLKTKKSRKEQEDSPRKRSPSKKDQESGSSPAALSPSSLSAKNVVRKKGEVVVAWTRDEDRAILLQLKTMGASRETFSALSEQLDKPSSQIAHRFYQLMKLFKEQEKMDT
ncbi:CASP8-associated protein 2 [Melanotaenia boesemani]|uniref:CASP8-associated protein 2 n=1 Tax=Melanotaenia boesemani TaxID=1250792 RepID=UPI001C0547C7|nr:CASP8-associated protein 2 [Melanotaenia boesemani]